MNFVYSLKPITRISGDILHEILSALAAFLEEANAEPESFVLIGGSALLALGLISRTTRDADIMAGVDAQKGLTDLTALEPTDPELLAATRWVLGQDAGEAYPSMVQNALKQLGYGRITHQL